MIATSLSEAIADSTEGGSDVSAQFEPCVLVLDDNHAVLQPAYEALGRIGFAAEIVRDGDTLVERAGAGCYVAILVMLTAGWVRRTEVCRALRGAGVVAPILLLAEPNMSDEIVMGLNWGADDFLIVPFDEQVFTARIQSFRRRLEAGLRGQRLQMPDLTFDVNRRIVRRSGRTISLSPSESRLLDYLLRHRGQLLPAVRIAGDVSTGHETCGEDVNTMMRELQRKLDLHAPRPLIRSVEGVGYVLDR